MKRKGAPTLDYQATPVLLPVFNEEKALITLLPHLKLYSQNILIIDDASTDRSRDIIKEHNIPLICNQYNEGKGACLQKGFGVLSHQSILGVITLDADGQHSPADLSLFYNQIAKFPNSLIVGERYKRKLEAPKTRYFANRLIDFVINKLLDIHCKDTQSGYRYYPNFFLNQIISCPTHRFAYETLLLTQASICNMDIKNIGIECVYNKSLRKSYYRPLVDSWEIVSVLFKYACNRWLPFKSK